MEKIKEALAKAKQRRGNEQPIVSTIKEKYQLQTIQPQTIQPDLDTITYSNSAIIKLERAHLEKHRIFSYVGDKYDSNSVAIDSLRTQILQKMEENNWRTLAVVSPTPESGKTMISINLAISIAHLPKKTSLLVDFDLRKPKVATYLGIHTQKSVSDYLEGKATIEDVMVNPGMPRFVVMPTMRPVPRSAEMISSNRVANLVNELKNRYDSRVIIFDLPPVLNADDAMMLVPQIDCVLLVIASGTCTQAEIEDTMHLLPKDNLVGVVINKAEEGVKQYYY